jgi:AcrR family transcriptional regulator
VPKIVDHDARRAAIGLSVMKLVAELGAEQATVRAVAKASGWSTGVLAHYFGSKDEMLGFAITEIGEGVSRRIADIDAGHPLEWVRAMLIELLPLDEQRRVELLAWYGFLSRALNNSDLSSALRTAHRVLEESVSSVLRQAVAAGQATLLGSSDDAALELLTFVDGLSLRHLFDPQRLGSTEMIRLLDAQIARLGGSEGRQS